MLMDALMVMVSVPLSLLLSNSYLSFDPFSWYGLLGWLAIGVASYLLFNFSGLYQMMWRFASTPDFYNILRNCGLLTIGLYFMTIIIRSISPTTGLNEREFIIFFFVTFAFISAPRLIYRYMREGPSWSRWEGRPVSGKEKRALFLGSLQEADVIISYTRANIREAIRVIGIITNDGDAMVGANIQGTPIVGNADRALDGLEEYFKDTEGVDIVIFGLGAEKVFPNFPELVRIARKGGAVVEQFTGLSNLRRSGKLTLEKVEMETILRRSTVSADRDRLAAYLRGKKVLVTGGAGSIGRVLVKRALGLGAAEVLVADTSEFNIFSLQNDHIEEEDRARVTLRILDICDKRQLLDTVQAFQPDIMFHAAALKHVPLLEENWESAIKTNVFGTLNCAEVAVECGVSQFVLISSDKAAEPTSVLGLTKLMAEHIVNGLHSRLPGIAPVRTPATDLIGVRFGNVFGSDGSVATIFQSQIDAGGPVTVTDPAMTRYLMTIPEAVDLVIMAATASTSGQHGKNHGIYMLDMGEPVSIMAVAETMIRLAGKKPGQDIDIVVTGARPGEKLHESLCAPGEEMVDVDVPSIFGLKARVSDWADIQTALGALHGAMLQGDKQSACAIMREVCRQEVEVGAADAAVEMRAASVVSSAQGALGFPAEISNGTARPDAGTQEDNAAAIGRAQDRGGSVVDLRRSDSLQERRRNEKSNRPAAPAPDESAGPMAQMGPR